MERFKRLIVIVLVFVGLGLITRSSSHGGLEVLKYIDENGISHIKIQAPRDIDHLILEILNDREEMTHFYILDYPLIKKNASGIQLNHFYITKRMANFNQFNKIRIYPQNNEGKIFDMEEIGIIDMTQDHEQFSISSEKTIKVMSYNIHHGKNLAGKNTIDQMVELINESGVEIIGIQEADSGMPRTRFQNQMKYLGNALSMNYVYGENLVIGTAKYGNGVLSKHPIVFSENIALPSGREPRGLLSTIIDVEGRKIHFLVTHLGLNHEERRKQISVILDYIQTLPYDVVLVGDFNAPPENDEMRQIRKKMVDVAAVMDKGHIPTFDLPVLSKRIDYIFVDQSIKANSYDVIKNRASDHYPIHSEIVLP
ncbi:endonuclease/exonuclease/phosphatase family protein [Alkaliphilus transvaalensis]|uniref:endonuclease/exonuclease/phosphatase family protein n=1 Tax=Alkaliphilus transvaalensis TaxID=114628 RepID=UPI0006845DDB|nr:endonuclease/exonuclease/phosphatase family protein [Alkaliphilus transvaalensis]